MWEVGSSYVSQRISIFLRQGVELVLKIKDLSVVVANL